MSESVASNRGLANLSNFSVAPAGDVGRKLLARIDDLNAVLAIEDAVNIALLSGQSFSFTIRELEAKKDQRNRYIMLMGYDPVFQMAEVAPQREQWFATMTRAEELEYRDAIRDMTPRYDEHIEIGDEFGKNGWTTATIATELASQAGLDFISAIPAHQVRQFRCLPTMSFVEAILELYKVYEPTVWVKDNKLFLFSFTTLQTQAETQSVNIPAIRNALTCSRSLVRPHIGPNDTFYLRGGVGPFNLSKYPGKTWTRRSRISLPSPGVRSPLIKEMLKKQSYYGGYETLTDTERGELYTVDTETVWALGVTGRRSIELLVMSDTYPTTPCEHWTGKVCGRGLACNGMGTTITCDNYNPVRITKEKKEQIKFRRSEQANIYEHTSWANETPRLKLSVQVIAGKLWKLVKKRQTKKQKKDSEALAAGEYNIIFGWLDPLQLLITQHTYDERGFHVHDTKIGRSCVYADSDCDNHDESLPGYCTIGREKCDHFIGGKCTLGRTCNAYGRLATCAAYTGQARICTKHEETDRALTFYYDIFCPDSTVQWKEIAKAQAGDITIDSVIKVALLGEGKTIDTGESKKGKYEEDGRDPECLIHDEIKSHKQISAQTYRKTISLHQLENGKHTHTTSHSDISAHQVPSHKLHKRGMTVFAKEEPESPPDTAHPRVERNDSNFIDWDDAEAAAKDILAELQRDLVQDVYVVPGELLLDKLSPFAVPANDDGTHLPFNITNVGFVTDSRVDTTVSSEKVVATSTITVRR